MSDRIKANLLYIFLAGCITYYFYSLTFDRDIATNEIVEGTIYKESFIRSGSYKNSSTTRYINIRLNNGVELFISNNGAETPVGRKIKLRKYESKKSKKITYRVID